MSVSVVDLLQFFAVVPWLLMHRLFFASEEIEGDVLYFSSLMFVSFGRGVVGGCRAGGWWINPMVMGDGAVCGGDSTII